MIRRALPVLLLIAGLSTAGLSAVEIDFWGLSRDSHRIFRSNAMGMPIEQIESFRKDEFPFILVIVVGSGVENRLLFKDGVIFTEWERWYDTTGKLFREIETEAEGTWERHYVDSAITREIFTSPDSPTEEYRYKYKSGGLREIQFSVDEQLVHRDYLDIDSRGRLIEIRREMVDETVHISNYSFPHANLYQEWHSGNNVEEYYRFRNGAPDVREVRRDDLIVEKEYWEETPEGVMSTEVYVEDDTEILSYYDERGRLYFQEEHFPDWKRRTQFYYDDDILSEKIIRQPGEKLHYFYTYDGDEKLSETLLERNGVITEKISYLPESVKHRNIYRDGIHVFTIRYENDVPIGTNDVVSATETE